MHRLIFKHECTYGQHNKYDKKWKKLETIFSSYYNDVVLFVSEIYSKMVVDRF